MSHDETGSELDSTSFHSLEPSNLELNAIAMDAFLAL